MSETTIEDIIEFIIEKLPENKGKILLPKEIIKIFNDLYNTRQQYFSENYIHHHDWPDDDEYNIIFEYIEFMKEFSE